MEALMQYSKKLTPEKLQRFRHALGLTQPELGARLGVDYQTIMRWEKKGTRVPMMAEVALREVKRARIEEMKENLRETG
jgi:DNA-binding transcriptional regulator YiaG